MSSVTVLRVEISLETSDSTQMKNDKSVYCFWCWTTLILDSGPYLPTLLRLVNSAAGKSVPLAVPLINSANSIAPAASGAKTPVLLAV